MAEQVKECSECAFACINGMCLCGLKEVFQESGMEDKVIKTLIQTMLQIKDRQKAVNYVNFVQQFVSIILQHNLNDAVLKVINDTERYRREWSDFQHDQGVEARMDLHRSMDIEERYEPPCDDISRNDQNNLNHS